MENSELLPCPFCGGEARYGTEEDLAVGGGVSLRYQVYCGKCLALCDSRKSERAAITAWNTRTPAREDEKLGWIIPLECMSDLAQANFTKMMRVISTGGAVDVVARVDSKDYRWQCDGLKYAELVDTRTQPRVTVEEVRECMAKARFNDVYPIGYPNDAGGCMSWEELPVHAKKRWFDKDAEVMLQAIKAAHPHLFKE